MTTMTHVMTVATSKDEAVAEACGYLNAYALPNVYDILKVLQAVTACAEATDPCSGVDPRIARANQILRDYRFLINQE